MRTKCAVGLLVGALLSSAVTQCSTFGGSSSDDAGSRFDAAPADATSTDAGVATPRCDLSKPFGDAERVLGLDMRDGGSVANPWFTDDELTVYFVSDLLINDAGVADYDIFVATRARPGDAFGTPKRVDELSSVVQENYVAGSRQGDLLFARTESLSRIYFASKGASGFGNVGPLLFPDAGDRGGEAMPSVRRDGSLLYFTSYGRTSQSWDIFRTPLPYAGASPLPISELNTAAYNEYFPKLSDDERTVYFASDRPPALANDFDVWSATRTSTADPFSNVRREDALSTSLGDYPSWLSQDQCAIYVTRASSSRIFSITVSRRPL
jgi:hypothetical protein